MKPNKATTIKVRTIEPVKLSAEDVAKLIGKWVLCQITRVSKHTRGDSNTVKYCLSLINCEDAKFNDVVSMKRAVAYLDSRDSDAIARSFGPGIPSKGLVGKQLYVKFTLRNDAIVVESVTIPLDLRRKKRVTKQT